MTTINSSNIAIVKRMAAGLALLTLVAGCSPSPEGDGGASGSVSGLEMATTMSVVTPTGGFAGSPALMQAPKITAKEFGEIIINAISGQIFPPGSDYETDKVSITVEDDANQSLDFVNSMLCFISQTRMAELVNTGPYTAFLDPAKCLADLDGVGNFRVVVSSNRAFEHSPQYVNVWAPFADFLGSSYKGGLILELIIFEEISTLKPAGSFELKVSVEIVAPPGKEAFPSILMNTRTVSRGDGKTEFISFFELGDPFLINDDEYGLGAADVLLDDPQGTSGTSVSFKRDLKVRCFEPDGFTPIDPCVIDTTQNSYEIVYNSTHMYRNDTGPTSNVEACFDRVNPFFEADNYGLYYEQAGMINGNPVTAGQRVATGDRFGFEYQNQLGWINRYRLAWYSDDGSLLPDGVQVTQTGLNNDIFVAHRSNGRLTRTAGKVAMVSSMPGAPFSLNGSFNNYPGNPASIASWDGAGRQPSDFGFTRWRIEINPATSNFEVVAGEVQDLITNELSISPVVVPAAIINDPVDAAGNPTNSILSLRSAAGLDMRYDNSLFVTPASGYTTYNTDNEKMFPWHSDLYNAGTDTGTTRTLYCYSNCLIGGIPTPTMATTLFYPAFQTATTTPGVTILTAINLGPTEGGMRTYTLESTGKKFRLIDNSNGMDVAILDTSNVMFVSQNSYYLRETAIPLIDIIHPVLNPGGTIFATNLPALGQDEKQYIWETGTNESSSTFTLSRVNAAGPVVTFGEKLYFFYQHDIADDLNVALNFPQVNMLNNSVQLMLYDGDLQKGYASFMWPYTSSNAYDVESVNMTKGVVLTDFDGINYVAKPTSLSQWLVEYEVSPGVPDTAPCTSILDISRAQNELQLPSAESLNPLIVNFSDIPIPINTPPRVIGGVIQ